MPMSLRIFVLLFILTCKISAQESSLLSIEFTQISVSDAIRRLSDINTTPILFSDDFFPSEKITKAYESKNLNDILSDLIDLDQFNIEYGISSIIISKKVLKQHRIYGYILSRDGQMSLPYAYLWIPALNNGVSANEFGQYSILVPAGKYKLIISFIGYESNTIQIDINDDQHFDILLESENELPEVIVEEGSLNNDPSNIAFGHDKLSGISERTPSLGGNDDLLHTAKSIAGVQTGGGGIGGYFIRGGSQDQNLFLMDGVPVYNPLHSLGLTSIFTPEFTKSLRIYKSGFRAKYGDKSSSVVDIQLRDGNYDKSSFQLDVNPQDAAVTIDTPIKKGKSSLFLYGRSTTSAYQFNSIIRKSLFSQKEAENSTRYFDLLGKFNVQLDAKNKFFVSFYKGHDFIKGENEQNPGDAEIQTDISWGNDIIQAKLQTTLTPSIFLNTSIHYNRYHSDFGYLLHTETNDGDKENFLFSDISSINSDYDTKIDLDYSASLNLSLKGGLNYVYKTFTPFFGRLDENSEEINGIDLIDFQSLDNLSFSENLNANKFVSHIETTWSKNRTNVQAGLRATWFKFNEDLFHHFQPRLSISQSYQDHLFLISLAKTVQYTHLLSNSEINVPQDIWYPSTTSLRPEETWHYNFSYALNHFKHWSFMNSIFYKNTTNKSFTSVENLEYSNQILGLYVISGQSKSYGVEFSAEYSDKKKQLSFNYTWSRSDMQFDGLNLGKSFPYQFDRRHEFKAVGSINISDNWVVGVSTHLSSGHPYLVTNTIDPLYGLVSIEINPPGLKNKFFTGWQHRIDLSLLYTFTTGVMSHKLKLNLYNTYDQMIPLYYTRVNSSNSELIPNFAIPILPTLAYSVKF